MKYLVLMVNGKEEPLIVGKGISEEIIVKVVEDLGAQVVAGGDAIVHNMHITCQGTLQVRKREITSRGLKDEVLLRHADFIE